MTIDDRLTHAGRRFRDDLTEPVAVHLAPGREPDRRARRAPRRRRRLVGIAVAVAVMAGVAVGVAASLTSSAPRRQPITSPGVATDPVSGTALADGTWLLTAATDGAGDIVLPTATAWPLDLRFDAATGLMTASDGCNDLRSTVAVDRDALVLGETTTSATGCSPADAAFRAAVARVFSAGSVTWAVTGDRLTIGRDGTILTYDRQTPTSQLQGRWTLSAAYRDGTKVNPSGASTGRLGLQFDPTPGHILVADGCNSLSVEYSVVGSTLEFGSSSSSLAACADELPYLVDGVFLTGTATWTVHRDSLTITRDATVLEYARS